MIFTLAALTLVNGGDFSCVYLPYDERKHLTFSSVEPSVVCLKRASWFKSPLCMFRHYLVKINATTPNAYPFHAFIGTSESDLRSRSPWLQEFSSSSNIFSVFNSPTPESGRIELFEDTTIYFSDLDSHCIAFISRPGNNLYDHPAGIDVKFGYSVDWFRVARFLTGLGFFLIAPLLSTNLTFYYFSGMGISIVGGVLVLLLFVMRLLPRRANFLLQGALLIGGGASSFFLFYLDHLRSILWDLLSKNMGWVLCYAFVTAIISGGILYWFSLPERLIESIPRTRILVQFIIRTTGIYLIATAPKLPSQSQPLTDFLTFFVNWATNFMEIDPSVVSAISPFVLRTLFVGVVLSFSFFLLSLKKKARKSVVQSPRSYHLPDLPCATSSPYTRQGMKPFWNPPGSFFNDTPSTTSYGGYGYWDHVYTDGNTESYWDGNGYVFSPIASRVKSNRSTPRHDKSIRRRSQVGWNVVQDAVLTDDEEDDEYS